ncbi:MAG: hypothetical protein FWD60_10980 [Candidatus Azobacteroides sp.]|nr:hypothetical protein [Candidatus Azobacteroides sp.]
MKTIHLDAMRTHIISMICSETNEKVLSNVELLLMKNNIPPMGNYSTETLRSAVLHSREDILNGRVVTVEEMRAKHQRI